jgi:hypothetical protein
VNVYFFKHTFQDFTYTHKMSEEIPIVSTEIRFYCSTFTIERYDVGTDLKLNPIEIYQSRHFSFSV